MPCKRHETIADAASPPLYDDEVYMLEDRSDTLITTVIIMALFSVDEVITSKIIVVFL